MKKASITIMILLLGTSYVWGNAVIKYNGKITPKDLIEVYGHRGARGLIPEQTMPSYETALKIGVDYVDMDIGMTKDGIIVITHDLGLNPNITRDKDGKWITEPILIKDLTYEELKQYDVGTLKPGTEYAKYFPYQKGMDGVYIPTLKEAFDYVKKIAGDKVGFQIEIKNDPTKPDATVTPKQFADALYKILKENDVINRSEVQAFDWQCLIELNKLDPGIKTAYLTDHTTETMTDDEPGTWIAGLKPKDYNYSLPKMIKELGGYCWEPYEMDITEKDVKEAHKYGLKIVPWGWPEMEKTEFNYKRVEEMIEWGVDGIITDRPDILRGVLAARGYKLPEAYLVYK